MLAVGDRPLRMQLASAQIKDDRPSYNGDYTGRRFSGLTQITPENVRPFAGAVGLSYQNPRCPRRDAGGGDGIMYFTGSNDAFALNAQSGEVLWHYSRPISSGLIDDASGHINRGVALSGTHLYMETDNAHLLCLDRRSGNLIWDISYAEGNKNYGAHRCAADPQGQGVSGNLGWRRRSTRLSRRLRCYDRKIGMALMDHSWPGRARPSESWPGDTYLHGGGTAWMPGTYDPELDTLYWGTGNASPDYDGTVRPGDDLYTSCLLAIDPDTGKLKWHFQFTPHDLYDYDAVETPVLVDQEYQGKPRKLIVEANRNGYVYVLDRTTGKFLSATQFVKQLTWAKGVDANGRPITTDLKPNADGTLICPGVEGATNWYSPSYSETTRLFYFSSLESCSVYFRKPAGFAEGKEYYSTGTKRDQTQKSSQVLLAFRSADNKICLALSASRRYSRLGRSHEHRDRYCLFRRQPGLLRSRGCHHRKIPVALQHRPKPARLTHELRSRR